LDYWIGQWKALPQWVKDVTIDIGLMTAAVWLLNTAFIAAKYNMILTGATSLGAWITTHVLWFGKWAGLIAAFGWKGFVAGLKWTLGPVIALVTPLVAVAAALTTIILAIKKLHDLGPPDVSEVQRSAQSWRTGRYAPQNFSTAVAPAAMAAMGEQPIPPARWLPEEIVGQRIGVGKASGSMLVKSPSIGDLVSQWAKKQPSGLPIVNSAFKLKLASPADTDEFKKKVGEEQGKALDDLIKKYNYFRANGLLTEDVMKSMASAAAGLADSFGSVGLPVREDGIALQKFFDEQVAHKEAMKKATEDMEDATLTGADLEIAQATRVYNAEIRTLMDRKSISDEARQEEADAFFAGYDLKVRMANRAEDTLEARLKKAGTFTVAELEKQSAAALDQYAQMAKAGTYPPEAMTIAWDAAMVAVAKSTDKVGATVRAALQAQMDLATEYQGKMEDLTLTGQALEVAQIKRESAKTILGWTREYESPENAGNKIISKADNDKRIGMEQDYMQKRVAIAEFADNTMVENAAKAGYDMQNVLQKNADNQQKLYAHMFANIGTGFGKFTQDAVDKQQAVADAAAKAAKGTKSAWDILGTVGESLGQMFEGINTKIGQGFKTFGSMFSQMAAVVGKDAKAMGQKLALAFSSIASVVQSVGGASVGAQVASGALGGAATGIVAAMAITGTKFTSVAGAWGMAIGSLVGAITGWISAMSAARAEAKKNAEAIQDLYDSTVEAYGGMERIKTLAPLLASGLADALNAKKSLKDIQWLVDAFKKALDALQGDLEKYGFTWLDLNDTWKKLNFGDLAKTAVDSFNRMVGAGVPTDKVLKNMSSDLNQLIIDAVKSGQKIPASLQPILQKMIELGYVSETAAKALLGIAIPEMPSLEDLDAAAQRYGMTLDDLGSKVREMKLSAIFQQYGADWKLFMSASADPATILKGMGKGVQNAFLQAQKMGMALPEQMRPVIQAMIDAGQLVDSSGKIITDIGRVDFAKDLTAATVDLTAAILALTDQLSGAGPNANAGQAAGGAEPAGPRSTDKSTQGSTAGAGAPGGPVQGTGLGAWQDWLQTALHLTTGGLLGGTGRGRESQGELMNADLLKNVDFGVRFAEGGEVPPIMWTPRGTDTVPAMLTPGEHVVPADGLDPTDAALMALIRAVDITTKSLAPIAAGIRQTDVYNDPSNSTVLEAGIVREEEPIVAVPTTVSSVVTPSERNITLIIEADRRKVAEWLVPAFPGAVKRFGLDKS
jgi:hypothetical protein